MYSSVALLAACTIPACRSRRARGSIPVHAHAVVRHVAFAHVPTSYYGIRCSPTAAPNHRQNGLRRSRRERVDVRASESSSGLAQPRRSTRVTTRATSRRRRQGHRRASARRRRRRGSSLQTCRIGFPLARCWRGRSDIRSHGEFLSGALTTSHVNPLVPPSPDKAKGYGAKQLQISGLGITASPAFLGATVVGG